MRDVKLSMQLSVRPRAGARQNGDLLFIVLMVPLDAHERHKDPAVKSPLAHLRT